MSSPITTEKSARPVPVDGEKEGQQVTPSLVSDDSFTNPTGINEKALVRRLDLRLLPPLTLLYLLSFLDRSNSRFPETHVRRGGVLTTAFSSRQCKIGRLDDRPAYYR
jgi:hypothetical protein